MDRFKKLGRLAACCLAAAGMSMAGPARGSEIELTSAKFMADEPTEAAAVEPAADASGFCPDCLDCDDRPCKLLGLFISPSDTTDFACFISPITNPVYFEDPRTLTEARPIFIQHKIPNQAPLAGGDVQVIAVQLRAAITENLSVIATKDGYIISAAMLLAPTAGPT